MIYNIKIFVNTALKKIL